MARRCRCPKCDSLNTFRGMVSNSSDLTPRTDEEEIAYCKSKELSIKFWYQCNDCQYIWRRVERRVRCPKCGSMNTVKICYGLPTKETIELAELGKIALGGCMVDDDSPKHYCKDCHNHWGKLRWGVDI